MSLVTRKLPSGAVEAQLGSLTVVVREKDGYINATRLCKDGGKHFGNWLRLDGTNAFLKVYDQMLNENSSSLTHSDVSRLSNRTLRTLE